MTAPTTLDLFSGACGGWSLGLERAGFRTIAACELDPWRRRIYGANFPHAKLFSDVAGLTAARLLAETGRLPYLCAGSPPCQDISVANVRGRGLDGARSGNGFDQLLRIVEECRPRWVAVENSPGLRTRGGDRVLARLEALAYAPTPLVVGAWHAGHLHRRQRVWILAYTDEPNADAARAGAAGFGPSGGWLELPQTHARAGHTADAHEIRDRRRRHRAERGEEAGRQPAEPLRLAEDEGGAGGRLGSHQLFPQDPPWVDAGTRVGRSLRSIDGIPGRLARQFCSALGDAVVPQISEAIGRAILRTEIALAAGSDRRIAA